MNIDKTNLATITAQQLAERVDQHDAAVPKATTAKILEFFDGLDVEDVQKLDLDIIDGMDVGARFKDLAVLGLLMRGAPTITPEKMGANLKETFEKMPSLEEHFDVGLKETKRRRGPFELSFVNKPYIAGAFVHGEMRSSIGPMDRPVGFTMRTHRHGSGTNLIVRNSGPHGAAASLATRVLGPSFVPPTYEVPLKNVPSYLLEQALEMIPATPKTSDTMRAIFETKGPDASEELRSAIQAELETRRQGPDAPARRFERLVDSLENA